MWIVKKDVDPHFVDADMNITNNHVENQMSNNLDNHHCSYTLKWEPQHRNGHCWWLEWSLCWEAPSWCPAKGVPCKKGLVGTSKETATGFGVLNRQKQGIDYKDSVWERGGSQRSGVLTKMEKHGQWCVHHTLFHISLMLLKKKWFVANCYKLV